MNNWEPWAKGFMQVVVFGVMSGTGHLIGLNAGFCFSCLCAAGFVAYVCAVASL